MSASTSARLLKEYVRETKDPNPAVKDLSPVADDNVYKWRGYLQGIPGSPYEGPPQPRTTAPFCLTLTLRRRRMAP
jgi:ubiquitin-protein ligase